MYVHPAEPCLFRSPIYTQHLHGECMQVTLTPDKSLLSSGMILTWVVKAYGMKLKWMCRIEAELSRKPYMEGCITNREETTQRWNFPANSLGSLHITLKLLRHWVSPSCPEKEVLLSTRAQWRVLRGNCLLWFWINTQCELISHYSRSKWIKMRTFKKILHFKIWKTQSKRKRKQAFDKILLQEIFKF